MISDALFDQVVTAYMDGDEKTLEHLAQLGVPVMTVIFVASEGGAMVYDDAGLLARIEQLDRA
jgi:hypothetical protein